MRDEAMSGEEKILVDNLLNMVGELPEGEKMIAQKAQATGGARVVGKAADRSRRRLGGVAKELRSGNTYGSAEYDVAPQNTGRPGGASTGEQIKDLQKALADQGHTLRQLLEGMGVVDSSAKDYVQMGDSTFDRNDLPLGTRASGGPTPMERREERHRMDREFDQITGLAAEELREHGLVGKGARRDDVSQVEKDQALAEIGDQLAAAVSKIGGNTVGKSNAEVIHEVSKELLVTAFQGMDDPGRTW